MLLPHVQTHVALLELAMLDGLTGNQVLKIVRRTHYCPRCGGELEFATNRGIAATAGCSECDLEWTATSTQPKQPETSPN